MNWKNKKGMTTIQIFLFIFAAFLGIILLGIAMWGFDLVNDNLGIDVNVGQVNLQNVTNQTFGKVSNAFVDNGDTIGIILLLGMCLFMIVNGYVIGQKYPKLWIVIDIFILVFAFVLAVYISQTYSTLINSSSILSIYEDSLPNSSTFVLNLPLVISIVGILIMIVTYAGIRKDEEQETTVLGYG